MFSQIRGGVEAGKQIILFLLQQDVFEQRMSSLSPMLQKYNRKLNKTAADVRGIRPINAFLVASSVSPSSPANRAPGGSPTSRKRSPSPRSKATIGRSASPSDTNPTQDYSTRIAYEDLPYVDTPCIEDTSFSDDDYKDEGVLGPDAASILMKILYLVSCCRFDLMHRVCMLAREITKWNYACDRRLYCLVCSLNLPGPTACTVG